MGSSEMRLNLFKGNSLTEVQAKHRDQWHSGLCETQAISYERVPAPLGTQAGWAGRPCPRGAARLYGKEPDLERSPAGVTGGGDVTEENRAAGGSDLDWRIRNGILKKQHSG